MGALRDSSSCSSNGRALHYVMRGRGWWSSGTSQLLAKFTKLLECMIGAQLTEHGAGFICYITMVVFTNLWAWMNLILS